jgi:RNA polymerase sigma-70 factor (ECF subfamily)
MTGSVVDGEDVVQDTLARAYYELSELRELPAMRSWLFRIAHNCALDFLRRYERRMGEPLDAAENIAASAVAEPEAALAARDAVGAATSRFLELAPLQRSCVILKDVLDYSLDEIAGLLELSVSAVKAALHRGRARLLELSKASRPIVTAHETSPALGRYADLFNARDWDGVRAMLVHDVKLDVISRRKAVGRHHLSDEYFRNYDRLTGWYMVPGWLEDREVLAVFREPDAAKPAYFIEMTLVGNHVTVIRDFYFVTYILQEAEIRFSR